MLRGAALGISAAIVIILVTQILWPGLFDAFEAKSLDWRYEGRLDHLYEKRQGNTIEEIIIIDIDNRSLEKLGRFQQWPRFWYADIIEYVSGGGALALGFDVLFMEKDQDPLADSALVRTSREGLNVYHSMAFSMADPETFLYVMETAPPEFDAARFSYLLNNKYVNFQKFERMDGKFFRLYNSSAGIGYANFSPDRDSVIRSMPIFLSFGGRQYPALGLAMILGMFGADSSCIAFEPNGQLTVSIPETETKLVIPIDRHGKMMVNYQGTFQTFRYISFYDVLEKRIPQDLFRDRIVLVGTSSPGLSDIRPVPFQDVFPGVEIHANVIYNILTQQFIEKQSILFAVINLVLTTLFIAVLAMLLKPWQSIISAVLIGGGFSLLSYIWFTQNAYWLELVRPVMAIVLAYLFVFFYRYVDEERNKRYIKNMFQFYLTASVVDELLRRPELLKLGGERRVATAFFSDIKNFTTVSEKLSPESLVAQLNEYLSEMTDIVLKYEGYLDKYEGDAIMAIFGIPIEQHDHPSRAVLAALEMQDALVELRKKWRNEGKPELYARMGINTGPMIAGNIGGIRRFDYTVIGDAVNLASRLEGVNKTYGTGIIISEYTRIKLDDSIVVRELDKIRVKGKNEPVAVFQVLSKNRSHLLNAQLLILEDFEKGLLAYRKGQWDLALSIFQRVLAVNPNDGPARTFLKRCLYFQKNPVPQNWDGVFDMKTK